MASTDITFTEKATKAWGDVPEWVAELAKIADARGLKGAGQAIGYTGSLVSGVLNAKYAGDMAAVEKSVRWALLSETVECPVLGMIDRSRCLEEQRQPFRATSAFRAQLYHACRGGCPNARPSKGDNNGPQ